MAKLISIVLAAIIAIPALAQETLKEPRDIGYFKHIYASKGVNVTLFQTKERHGIEVVTQGCPTTDIETTLKGDELHVRLLKRTKGSAVEVFVYVDDIQSAEIKGGASFSTQGIFIHKGKFDISVGANCEAEIEIDTDELDFEGNSCIATVYGRAKEQNVEISGTLGSCTYDAEKLLTEETDLEAHGCNAVVRASKFLEIEAKGANVKYFAEDKTNVKVESSLGSTVERVNK